VTISYSTVLRGILLFWAAWFAVVTLTNLADGLVAAGALPAAWPFASGNFALVATVTNRYPRPDWIVPLLMLGVIAWEATAAVLFARACAAWHTDLSSRRARATAAYAVAIGLWATFLVIDEAFIAYEMENTHFRLFTAHVLCLMATRLDAALP
jgi:hypothetical protein